MGVAADYMSGFVTHSKAAYPDLWEGNLQLAVAAGLGSTGTILEDHSGFRRNGTMDATMPPSSGWAISGGQYSNAFDGTNDNMRFGDVLNFGRTDRLTFSFWYRCGATSPSAAQMIMGKQLSTGNINGYAIRVRGDQAGDPLDFILRQSSTSVLTVSWDRSNDTNWHHVIVTYTGNSLPSGVAAWVDGVSKTITTVTNSLTGSIATTAAFTMGSRNGDAAYFNGNVDDVRIYQSVLPESQIQILALRRCITYESKPERRRAGITAAGAFRAAWLTQRSHMIGGR